MPRTKVPKVKKNKPGEGGIEVKLLLEYFPTYKKMFEEELKQTRAKFDTCVQEYYTHRLAKTKSHILNMKLSELSKMSAADIDSTIAANVTQKDNVSQMKSTTKGKKAVSRSSSLDEGYLTTESSRSVSNASAKSRGRPKDVKSTRRMTRSLSRNSISSTRFFTTPANKGAHPDEFGAITPKCKPNSAQILMRRPKKGEIALSFKGSPLLVNAINEDTTANINIPLEDGTMLSLLPQRGLRMSQIPQFDSETLRQLETLNKNLDLVLKKAI